MADFQNSFIVGGLTRISHHIVNMSLHCLSVISSNDVWRCLDTFVGPVRRLTVEAPGRLALRLAVDMTRQQSTLKASITTYLGPSISGDRCWNISADEMVHGTLPPIGVNGGRYGPSWSCVTDDDDDDDDDDTLLCRTIFGYTCARLSRPHSAFQSTLNSSIVSYRVVQIFSVSIVVTDDDMSVYQPSVIADICIDFVRHNNDPQQSTCD